MITSRTLRHLSRLLLMSTVLGVVGDTRAQVLTSNAIRIVVPGGPGSPPDVLSRVVAAELSETEGWRVVVENRPGALQTIGAADVLKQLDKGQPYPGRGARRSRAVLGAWP